MKKKKLQALLLTGTLSVSMISPTLQTFAKERSPEVKSLERVVYDVNDPRMQATVEFKDLELKKALIKELNTQRIDDIKNRADDAIIYVGELTRLKGNINLSNKGITDLEGIEYLTAIDGLDLSSNALSNLTQLSTLTNLQSLNLNNNALSDISSLTSLTNLQELNLNENEISDLSTLINLTNLQTLRLDSNNIEDLSPLTNLINLQELRLDDNNIEDINSLSNLTNLKVLRLGINNLTNISALKELNNLYELNIGTNNIKDIEPLKNLSKLTTLYIDNNEIDDINVLTNLRNLNILYLDNNHIYDFSVLKPKSNYKEFSGKNQTVQLPTSYTVGNKNILLNPIKDVGGKKGTISSIGQSGIYNENTGQITWSNVPDDILSFDFKFFDGWISGHVEIPRIDSTEIQIPDSNFKAELNKALNAQNIDGVSNRPDNGRIFSGDLGRLTGELYFNDKGIENIEGAQYLTGISKLELKGNKISDNGNKISDISPLSNLTNLTWLKLDENSIEDLSPLSKLTNLKLLALPGNNINDISSLSNLTNLTTLYLGYDDGGNNINDISPLSNLTNLLYLNLANNQINDISPLYNLINLNTLIIRNNAVNNISSLINLINLTNLDLSTNNIEDINPLAKSTKLTHLYVSNNQISDISVISDFNNLQEFKASNNDIVDISALKDRRINVLNLDNNKIFDERQVNSGTCNVSVQNQSVELPTYTIANSKIIIDNPLRSEDNNSTGKDVQITNISDSGVYDSNTNRILWNNISNVKNSVTFDFRYSYENNIFSGTVTLPILQQEQANIPDKNFRKALINELNSQKIDDINNRAEDAIIYVGELKKLKGNVNLSNKGITDLEGIEYLTGINALNLKGNNLTDISNLAVLTNLTSLDISENQISNIDAIQHLTKLTKLELRSNKIENISPLTNLTNLTNLGLSSNNISDLTSLTNLNNLTWIDFRSNKIEDISSLTNLTNLTSIALGANKIEDISPLANLTNLTFLNVRNNKIKNVSSLAKLTDLRTLDLSYNNINDVSPLVDLNKLTSIDLRNNHIADFTPLKYKTFSVFEATDQTINLEASYTVGNKNIILNPIKDHTGNRIAPSSIGQNGTYNERTGQIIWSNVPDEKLTFNFSHSRVNISGSVELPRIDSTEIKISDSNFKAELNKALNAQNIDGISNRPDNGRIFTGDLSRLTGDLSFDDKGITNIEGAQYLTGINSLTLMDNQIEDISPLANLTNLTKLKLDRNNISNISALSNLTNLVYFAAPGNNISDISPLANLTNLTTLILSWDTPEEYGNNISDISPLANLTNLQELYVAKNDISDISSLANLTNLINLDLSNNNIEDLSSLANLTNLTYLRLSHNNITDINPLAKLAKLNHLIISDNKISDISIISNLRNLTKLYAANNDIFDVSALLDRSLKVLDLDNNKIFDSRPVNSTIGKTNVTVRNQKIELPTYIIANSKIILNNPLRSEKPSSDGRDVKISNISDGGVYDSKTNRILWNNIATIKDSVTFDFSYLNPDDGAPFNGTVTLPVSYDIDRPIIDKEGPIITFDGVEDPENTPIEITTGSSYEFSTGVTATDDVDGSVKVTVDSSNVNLNAPGKYTVIYTATDKAGNITTITRPVIVKDKETAITDINKIYFNENNSTLYINASFEGIDNQATESFTKTAKLIDSSNGKVIEDAVITTQNFNNDKTYKKFQLGLSKDVQDKLKNGTYNIEVSAEINGKQHKALLSSTKEYNIGRDTIYAKCQPNSILTIEKTEAQKAEAQVSITNTYFNKTSNNFILEGTFEGANIDAENQFAKTATIVDESGNPIDGIAPIKANNLKDSKFRSFQLIVSRDILDKLSNGTYKIKMSGVINSITCEGIAKSSKEFNVINTTACEGKILKAIGTQDSDITLVKDDFKAQPADVDITKVAVNSKSNNFVIEGTFIGIDANATQQFAKVAKIVNEDENPIEGIDPIKVGNLSDPGKFAKFQLIISPEIMSKLEEGTYKIKLFGTIDGLQYAGVATSKKSINIYNPNAVPGKNLSISALENAPLQLTKGDVKTLTGTSNVTIVQSTKNGYSIKGTFGAVDTIATTQFKKTATIVNEQGEPVNEVAPLQVNNLKDEPFESFQLLIPTEVLNKLQDGTYKIKMSGTINGSSFDTILKSAEGIPARKKQIDEKLFVVQAEKDQELNLSKSSK